jgi:cytochrome c553
MGKKISIQMQKIIPFIAILIVLAYAVYNAKFRHPKKVDSQINSHYKEHIKVHKTTHYEDELSKINTDEYTKQYIIKVIDHGSAILDFKGGVMEGGFAEPEDAEKIACYTMEFSSKKCEKSYPEDAAMCYTSICGGCHGNDGKGLGGTYPDLTKAKMLGIERREIFLKTMQKHRD